MSLEQVRQFQKTSFQIGRYSDKEVVETLLGLAAEGHYRVEKANYRFTFSDQSVEITGDQQDSKLQELLGIGTVSTQTINFVLSGWLQISVDRGWDQQHRKLQGNQDTVSVSPVGQNQPQHNVVEFAKALFLARKHFKAVDTKPFMDFLDEGSKQLYQSREQEIQRLERMQEEFFEKLQRFTTEQAEAYQRRVDALEAKHATRQQQLDEDHQAKAKALADERAGFEAEKKEFDDRESKHLRRQIREQLKTAIEAKTKTFSLSKETQRRRWPVILVYSLLMGAFGGLAVYFLFFREAKGEVPGDYILIGRQALFTLAFGVTAAFFIRWLNQWFRSHADEEFKLLRLGMDIDRAHTVFEMALEWKAEKDTDIPDLIVDRLSRNLFAEGKEEDSPVTAVDALASALLGSAASAKLKLGDAEISLDRKAIEKLKKDGNGKV